MSNANEYTIGCCTECTLSKDDPELYAFMMEEADRQFNNLEMIASENYTSQAVLEAAGSILTNKYAEGYPGRRYYGGCEHVDKAENLAIERAKKLFGCEHVNVQPHAGSPANMAAYFALIEPGAKIMAMNLAHGGHLTHGSPVNFSGRMFQIIPYGVTREDNRIDFAEVRRLAREHKPALIVGGATAYPRIIDFAAFREIADEVGAKFMVDAAHIAGLIAGGVHPSPVPYCEVVTMTTHKTLRGPRGGLIVCREEFGRAVDRQVFPGLQGGPLMHIVAAKAVALGEALRPEFRDYTRRIVENCKALAAGLMSRGFRLVSGGTDNHLILVDFTGTPITGKAAEEALGTAGITVNKNNVPFDTRKPTVTSGIRIGTAALTTRGMGVMEMRAIAGFIRNAVDAIGDDAALAGLRAQSRELARSFPIFKW